MPDDAARPDEPRPDELRADETRPDESPRTARPAADDDQALTRAWQRTISELAPSQKAFLRGSQPLTLHGSTLIVAVGDDFSRSHLESRMREQVEGLLGGLLGHEVRLAVTVDPALADSGEAAVSLDESLHRSGDLSTDPSRERFGTFVDPRGRHSADMASRTAGRTAARAATERAAQTDNRPFAPPSAAIEARLNPKYVFDSFVIGSSNRFAHAATVACAEAPGKAYNPLLVYGDSGLGKTHLLHAIGHYVCSLYSGARVRYVSSEEFTNDFINAIRDDRAASFQRRYRDVDVLLIDDIQFLEGKVQTQEEFFHTFNTLHNANKQIVITSDRPPKRLEALEDRLRSRFEWGLITDVQPPDLETRIAILRKKAAMEKLTAPSDVLEFIASKIQTNIRELEGALIRATAFASLNRQPVDLTLAEIVLKDLIPEGGEPEISAGLIIGQTANYFSLTIDDLTGSSRSRLLVTARQIAMYLCRELTDLSLPKIGQQFGRDHTTVMHADKKVRRLLGERRTIYNQVAELTNRIKQAARAG